MQTSRAKVPTPKQLSSVGVKKDDFETFWHILITYCQQDYEYMDFFEGGTLSQWRALAVDNTRGINITATEDEINNSATAAEDARKKTLMKRAALNSLLTTIAAYCPYGMFKSIITDSTSIEWIKQRLIKVCNVETNGRHLPKVMNISFNRGEESPAAFFERIKSTFMDSLNSAGTMYHGSPLTTPETLSPTFESMLVILCLKAIHPSLPDFIMENKGNLFSNAQPNYCDIQGELWETMDTLLAQLENQESASRINTVENKEESLRWIKGSKFQKNKNQTSNNKLCEYCKALGKDMKIWSSHNKLDCFSLFPEKKRNNKQYSRMLSVPVYTDENDSWDLQEALTAVENQFNAFQMGDDPIENEDPQ